MNDTIENTPTLTVQIRDRGVLTLPAEIREKYNFRAGDTLRLIDLGGVLVLTRMVPMVEALAREIEQARIESGVSMEEMLSNLREQRERYTTEHYNIERFVRE